MRTRGMPILGFPPVVPLVGQGAAMVGAVSRWVPSFSSASTNWATSARLMESRIVTGRRG